ncbi:hypothetical protein KUCAC02_027018 [Chaenocephalus aceratus]|uniref:Uncharacterized protein n=1 Tax=Chaenocephalus aceratus TaxID=36190 RepID=A0ACB9W2A8_CHAAC|nr:hypothetical protein KUCAC02_027018 [Chaenocephalus aceratus]
MCPLCSKSPHPGAGIGTITGTLLVEKPQRVFVLEGSAQARGETLETKQHKISCHLIGMLITTDSLPY